MYYVLKIKKISQHSTTLALPVVQMKVCRLAFLSNDSHPAANIESQYKLNIRIINHTVIPYTILVATTI